MALLEMKVGGAERAGESVPRICPGGGSGGRLGPARPRRPELRAKAVPGGILQLGEPVGHAEVKELYGCRGESVVKTGVAAEGLGGPLIVDVEGLVEGAL